MSKKPKEKKVKEVKELNWLLVDEDAYNEPKIHEEVSFSNDEAAAPVVAEPVYTCADAARRFIVGYKDHWLNGIEAHIKSNNASLSGTEAYFKIWFKSWGAQIK
jgi:hypothetical protein